jgi:hypothetical protein
METEEVSRLYSGLSDSKMLNRAQGICNLLKDDVAEFASKDAEFDLDFVEAFEAAIDVAYGTQTDETFMDEMETLTSKTMKAWWACQDYFQDMKYYIERAFPGNARKHDQFGYNDYREMTRQQNRVMGFMDQLEDMANEHSAQLLAAGMTVEQLEQIAVLRQAFWAADRAQERKKKLRPVLTAERIEVYNAVWRILQRVNRLSKLVYRGDYVKLHQYMLPASGSNERASLSVTGVVFDNETQAPVAGATVSLPAFELETQTDDEGKYGFTKSLPIGTTQLVVKATGYQDISMSVQILSDKTLEANVGLMSG